MRMVEEKKQRSSPESKNKKPGPRPTKCLWCGSTECTHCRCTGQIGCNHKKGEMCSNQRYKRRLVCNSCEKNKLREKQQINVSTTSKRKRGKTTAKSTKKKVPPLKQLKLTIPPVSETNEKSSIENNPIQPPSHFNCDVFLTNTNSIIGRLLIQNNVMPLSAIRPHIVQLLEQIEESTDFVFNRNGLTLSTDQEYHTSLSDVSYYANNIIQVSVTVINNIIHPVYPQYPVQLSPDRLSTFPTMYTQGYSQPYSVESPQKFWNGGATNPVQRMLQEAKKTGRLDSIINQSIPLQDDFVFDDRPRDIQRRGDSYPYMGSYDHFFSRPDSMFFFNHSRPGSQIFGSNVSLNGSQCDDLVSNIRKYDDDINRSTPNL